MKKYDVPVLGSVKLTTYVQGFTTIEANSLEEAKAIAKKLSIFIDVNKAQEIVDIEPDCFEWCDSVEAIAEVCDNQEPDMIMIDPDDIDDLEQYEV